MKKLLFVFGTRPEAIKMAPVVHACNAYKETLEVKICITGQHKEMLYQVMDFFQLKADYDLGLMKPNQTLFEITADGLMRLQNVLNSFEPDIVLVQGDTTTAFVGALASFYKKIKIAHIEAGLRSFDKFSPYPEEVNRKMVSVIADYHFAPTEKAVNNLHRENIHQTIFNVGNTVVDALLWAVNKVKDDNIYTKHFQFLDLQRKIILITAHRRESFGEPFKQICEAVATLAIQYPDIQFVYPVHLNPNVQGIVRKTLSDIQNIHLIEPLDYPHLVWIMNQCYFVITDSGGIQEEAPTLGKPVLVIRNVTEREEGITAGTALLIGTSKEKIIQEATRLLENENAYSQMSKAVNPYGKGHSAETIVELLLKELL